MNLEFLGSLSLSVTSIVCPICSIASSYNINWNKEFRLFWIGIFYDLFENVSISSSICFWVFGLFFCCIFFWSIIYYHKLHLIFLKFCCHCHILHGMGSLKVFGDIFPMHEMSTLISFQYLLNLESHNYLFLLFVSWVNSGSLIFVSLTFKIRFCFYRRSIVFE